jgi:transposase
MEKNFSEEKKDSKSLIERLNLNAAGIDIGSAEIFVCVPSDRDEKNVRKFGTFTEDLRAIGEWLLKCKVDTAAMESTGVYWIPLYDILEGYGIEVYLVEARKMKNVPGRKTDVADCQWIQELHSYGLLTSSYVPDETVRKLRDLVRHREKLVESKSTHILRMQKQLELMNIKITNVISDITGQTGMNIIRSITEGHTDAEYLSQFRDKRCKASAEVIKKSLEGKYTEQNIFVLKQEVEIYNFYNKQIIECDKEIEKVTQSFPDKIDGDTPQTLKKTKKRDSNKNAMNYDIADQLYKKMGVDLTEVDGLGTVTIQTIVSEIGTDVSKWQTSKHFSNWLGLCPSNEKSGGKVIRNKTKKVKNRLNKALRLAAYGISKSDSWLGGFFRRKRAQKGPTIAITATAHKLAVIIYNMIKNKTQYYDLGATYYDEKYKNRMIKNLKQKAKILGYNLDLITT